MPAERGQIRTLVILGALGLTFVLGLWLPFRAKRTKIEQQLSKLDTAINAEQQGAAGLATIGQKIVSLSHAVARFDKTVPREPELASLMRELTGELENQDVTSLNVVPGKAVEGDAYCLVPIALTFDGSFQALFGLLEQIESMDRLVQINTIDATGNPDNPGAPLPIRIELSAFYMPTTGDSDG